MIYNEENISKKQNLGVLDVLSPVQWKYILSFLENLNVCKEVNSKFVDLKWIKRIKMIDYIPTTGFVNYLSKLFQKRTGGVEYLDFREWNTISTSFLNRLVNLKVFRQLKEVNIDDSMVFSIRLAPGIKISAKNNHRMMLINAQRGMSYFDEKMRLLFSALDWDFISFFRKVCAAINLEINGGTHSLDLFFAETLNRVSNLIVDGQVAYMDLEERTLKFVEHEQKITLEF